MNTAALSFAPCPVQTPQTARIKVALTNGDVIKLTLNGAAYKKLGSPPQLEVSAASDENGQHFLKVLNAPGWPVSARKPPRGESVIASCKILTHPFKPGVTHRPVEVEAHWDGDAAVLQMPNWERMLDEIELGGDDSE